MKTYHVELLIGLDQTKEESKRINANYLKEGIEIPRKEGRTKKDLTLVIDADVLDIVLDYVTKELDIMIEQDQDEDMETIRCLTVFIDKGLEVI